MSSASRFPSPSRSIFPKAGSSPRTPRPCRAIPTTATRLRRSSLRSRRRSAQPYPHRRRSRLSQPQRTARLSLQGLYLSPEAMHYRTHQARLRRRPAVEPVIDHAKGERRMGRNYLASQQGDAANAVLAAAGYDFRRLLAWLKLWLSPFLCAIARPTASRTQPVVD